MSLQCGRFSWIILDVANSLNKQKLAEVLEREIVHRASKEFSFLDSSQYDLLKKVVSNGGRIEDFEIDQVQVEERPSYIVKKSESRPN
jgi:hypothetical protein